VEWGQSLKKKMVTGTILKHIYVLLCIPYVLVSSSQNVLVITSGSTDPGIMKAVGNYYDDGEAYDSIRFRLDSTDEVRFLYRTSKGFWSFTGSEANVEKGKGTIISLEKSESPVGLSFKFYNSQKKWEVDESFSVGVIETEEEAEVVEDSSSSDVASQHEEEVDVEIEEEEEEAPLPEPEESEVLSPVVADDVVSVEVTTEASVDVTNDLLQAEKEDASINELDVVPESNLINNAADSDTVDDFSGNEAPIGDDNSAEITPSSTDSDVKAAETIVIEEEAKVVEVVVEVDENGFEGNKNEDIDHVVASEGDTVDENKETGSSEREQQQQEDDEEEEEEEEVDLPPPDIESSEDEVDVEVEVPKVMQVFDEPSSTPPSSCMSSPIVIVLVLIIAVLIGVVAVKLSASQR
jgi:hypothetical protein